MGLDKKHYDKEHLECGVFFLSVYNITTKYSNKAKSFKIIKL